MCCTMSEQIIHYHGHMNEVYFHEKDRKECASQCDAQNYQ